VASGWTPSQSSRTVTPQADNHHHAGYTFEGSDFIKEWTYTVKPDGKDYRAQLLRLASEEGLAKALTMNTSCRWLARSAVLALQLVFSRTSVGDTDIEQQDLFVAGQGGYHTYRIPAVIVSRKGTVGKLTYTTAIVVIPPEEVWPAIQAIRTKHDSEARRWMPHMTLVYPCLPLADLQAAQERLGIACRTTPETPQQRSTSTQ
jgi:hypothetical protein